MELRIIDLQKYLYDRVIIPATYIMYPRSDNFNLMDQEKTAPI